MNLHLNFTVGHRTTRLPRRGSTLIVVLALLALLSMLGLALVVFSGSEKTSAQNFSASIDREMRSQPRPSGEILSQFAISRLVLGGLSTEVNSAMYGGRHSLVPNLVGRDLYPHNGRGINVITDLNTPGSSMTDQDYDGNPDPLSQLYLQISDLPVYEDLNLNGQLDSGEDVNGNGQLDYPPYSMIGFLSRSDPDVGFTAPDINSAFLSFNGHVHNKNVNQLVHAFTPSFARPQYRRLLVPRNVRSSWETHTSTVRNVLRPHPSRVDFTFTEDQNNNGVFDLGEDLNGNGNFDTSGLFVRGGYRYVRTLREAQRLGLSGPFPFNADEDLNGDGLLTLYEDDLNGNGQLDPLEDLNGNGQFDSGEDQNRNGQLDPGEDINGNGYLELHEDQNQNGVLDSGSRMGVWDVQPLLQSTFYRAGECVQHNNNFYRVMRSGNSGQDLSTYIQTWTRLESPLQPRYQLDADPDGDGVKEAVWLDLDFPIQSLGDGRKAVPLFAFTIIDADGLINFNTAGNTSGFINLQSTRNGQVKFGTEDLNGDGQLDPGEDANGNGRLDPNEDQNNDGLLDPGEDLNLNGQLDHFISRSNLGMTPSEINPLWALDAGSKTNDQPVDRNTLEMFSDQKIFFHQQAPRTPQENANMEWWFALKGRPITDVGSGTLLGFLPGRHGDIQRLIQAANAGSNNPLDFPQPGIPLADLDGNGQIDFQEILAADDNWNAFEGHGYGEDPSLTPNSTFPLGQRGARRIPFGHPLDVRGSGTLHHLNHTNDRSDPLLYFSSTSNTPGYWLQYWGFHALATINPTIQWGRGLQSGSTVSGPLGPLMLNTPANQFPLVDNQEESIVDSRYRSSDDNLFATEENFFLQGSERDLESTGVNSRLGSLLSYNLSINNRAKEIRKRFTVDSWDTRNATRPRYPKTGNVQTDQNRPWEFDSIPPTPAGGPAPTTPRWFPPCYNNFSGNPAAQPTPIFDPKDPFRPAVRQLLQQTNDPTVSLYEDPTKTLRKLSLNHLVEFNSNGQPVYRELADHPVHEDLNDDGQLATWEDVNNNGILDLFVATALPREWTGNQLDTSTLPPSPTPNPQMQQEFQARVDRQRMARDIYVLLYMFCGGQDDVPYHTTSNAQRDLYTEGQLREMAQFAVNLVDSLDRDQVITKFEYDKNLSNGWMVNPNISAPDDNPFNGDEDNAYGSTHQRYNYRYPEDGQERGVVYGVEAQQLTLSEFLAIRSTSVLDAGNAGEDHPATAHIDTEHRHYAYIELHNASPHPVSVGGGHWQIVLQPSNTQTPAASQVRTVILWDDNTFTNDTPILAGNKFTIGSAADDHTQTPTPGTTTAVHSEFWVDRNFDTTDPDYVPALAMIAPRQTTTNWLDLLEEHIPPFRPNGERRFRITDGAGTDLTATAGSLLTGIPAATATTHLNLRIVLRRRLHTRRQVDSTNQADIPSSSTDENGTLEDNPWVEVDSMIYKRDRQQQLLQNPVTTQQDWEFTIQRDEDAADNMPPRIANELTSLRSRQRVQPFDARTTQASEASTPRGGQAQPYWPNNSVNLPLTHITNSLGAANVLDPGVATASPLWQNHPDRNFASIGELLSVPLSAPWEITNSDMTWAAAQSPGDFRGLSLLSDPALTHTAGYKKFLRTRDTTSGTAQAGNRWYRLFSFAEVGTRTDHFPSVQLPDYKKFRVPGRINLNTVRHPQVLGALLDEPQLQGLTRPFMVDTLGVNRWYQFLESRNGLDPVSSLFLPGTATSKPFRDFGFIYRGEKSIDDTLFRSLPLDKDADADGWITGRRLFGLGNLQTNYLSRLRLLSKIAGNTTTRSNVFHVFLKVSWFEAYRNPANGNVRIGAQLKDAASHRAFFVLDRSRILEHLKPTHLSTNPGDLSVGTGTNGGSEQLDPSTIILHSQVIE